ncbi:uncharacterized protein LOC122369563 [Amphibalanus amphitrite]|uniref:uncharacterized protein LOC122369563 n=1 Tax=Amphibalanus amphitrite TaxID=1232801 RepID=UPI001C9132D5|nr:uncharacterized protein LOC122369563 [Amphibalanus amphitrite]
MSRSLILAALAISAAGSVDRCHVCKTANALDVFANLHCDSVPETAPDCSLTRSGGGSDFFQHCPQNSNCITITQKEEELRMCTQKQRLETMKTTDGTVMEVCGSNMCNSAVLASMSLVLMVLPLLSALVAGRVV